MQTNRVREFRTRAQIPRSKLARLVGLEGHSIYRIETGRQGTSLATARALAAALTDLLGEPVSIDDLFGSQPEEATA